MKKKTKIILAVAAVTIVVVGALLFFVVFQEENEIIPLSSLGYRCYGFGINPPGEVQANQTTTIWRTNWTLKENATYMYGLSYGITFELEGEDSVSFGVHRNLGYSRTGGGFIEENGVITPSKNKYEYEFNYALVNQSVSEYGAYFMHLAQNIFTNFSFISNTTTTINGMNAYVCVFIGEYGTNQTKIKQVFVEKNGVVFELRYSASPSLYDQFITVVDQSINSFTIQ